MSLDTSELCTSVVPSYNEFWYVFDLPKFLTRFIVVFNVEFPIKVRLLENIFEYRHDVVWDVILMLVFIYLYRDIYLHNIFTSRL